MKPSETGRFKTATIIINTHKYTHSYSQAPTKKTVHGTVFDMPRELYFDGIGLFNLI